MDATCYFIRWGKGLSQAPGAQGKREQGSHFAADADASGFFSLPPSSSSSPRPIFLSRLTAIGRRKSTSSPARTDGSFEVVRCKDTLGDPLAADNSSHYRDVKFNVAVKNAEVVFVGELVLNLRGIAKVRDAVHSVYKIDRAANGSHYIGWVSPGLSRASRPGRERL